MNRKLLGIYIHIPFCVQKCLYCDFVSGPASGEIKKNYVNCLLKEIEACIYGNKSGSEYIVDTIFIGGGTPSVLDADWIEEILCKLKEWFEISDDCECTIEVNPGTVDFTKLKKYREAGINRLSIGLQSCNDNELKILGRIHNFKDFEDMFQSARMAGFDNINVDLMSSIPEQTEESFIQSLKRVINLKPEHISVYSLIVEEGTPFYEMDLNLPDEDTERQIYYKTGEILKEHGYGQYEISNYAKPEKECKHNIRYWQCDEYIGFGVAAASYFNGVRWKNTEDINFYIKYMQGVDCSVDKQCAGNINDEHCTENSNTGQGIENIDIIQRDDFYSEKDILTPEEQCAEFMFMGLRMNKGVSAEEFYKRFGITPDEKYGEIIAKHIQNGLLVQEENCIRLTDKGRDVCNFVMADFL